MTGRVLLVIQDLRFPRDVPCRGIEPEHVVVVARVDDEPVINGDVAVVGRVSAHVVVDIVREVAAVVPLQVSSSGIERLNDVTGLRHVEDPVVDERRPFLAAWRQRPRPHHFEGVDVLAADLLEWAVAPAVGGPAPHQPVIG